MSDLEALNVWLEKLVNLHSKEIDLGLDRVRQVGKDLAVLCPAPFVITVAGTNGKGSSVAMLQAILIASGYRVGAYTSPHILRFNERIKVNGVEVTDQQIIQAFEMIEQARKQTTLTYFEFATLASLVIFSQAKLDVVILEVGLGGRLDAVNIVDANAALLTSIDIDHVDWLGSDRDKIGFEKAGVMRTGALAVCSDPAPPDSVIKYAREISADLKLLGRDFSYTRYEDKVTFSSDDVCFEFNKPRLKGDFQSQNAVGVVALLMAQSRLDVSLASINKGLTSVVNPGRLETLQVDNQAWLFDVAHNPQSVAVLADYLSNQSQRFDKVIFAGLADKDLLPMVRVMVPYALEWIAVDLNVGRALSVEKLVETLTQAGVGFDFIQSAASMQEAVNSVKASTAQKVLVYGSFITVSQAMELLGG
ncbi:bifunctional tetrahydrofolate synthase/dihydrofolate synthase [Thiomicrospira microaerophila]|uniref:bifunctional tetrahydrofolate synthase/dihydrofolate synthase n=1 Tax=Thiomicrospira microaerophila TaxID=406020 RepID=UPI0020101D71|nr:bifunctional tetrahydrofolate synthase/dihydrofolate synthase [Thiomicrospira microaerophila]UQB42853.1 bifunctional tetrahydrofolate synthase/dihydrofolate synthase [Thiomicrospira microaerophila]